MLFSAHLWRVCKCIFAYWGVVTCLRFVGTFFKKQHWVVLPTVVSPLLPKKISAGQTKDIHSYTFNLWERTLANNPWVTLIVTLTHLLKSCNSFFLTGYVFQSFWIFLILIYLFASSDIITSVIKRGQVTFAPHVFRTMKSIVDNQVDWSILLLIQMAPVWIHLHRTLQFFHGTHITVIIILWKIQ